MNKIVRPLIFAAVTFPVFAAAELVPFVIPARVHPASQIAMEAPPLGAADRLTAGEHFVDAAGGRVRLWGVNLSFGANFPTHADAEHIAARMAAFGVNSVRFHHMDSDKWPRGIWDSDGRGLHPEAMDRLDYFLNQLALHGIYANLNLHVGKKYSAMLDIPDSPTDYDKMVNIFTPELIAAQKDYARNLLTHKNPYRNMTYAEDYAVAIVEITNENSLFMWGAENTLRTLPAFYADLLQKQYTDWLKNKYTTQSALQQAWLGQSIPFGENMLQKSTFTEKIPEDNAWHLEQHEGCRALSAIRDYNGKRGLCLEPAKTDGTGWHLQFNQRELNLLKDTVYTVEFDAAAPESRPLNVGAGQAHEPWGNLGLSQTFTLTPEWKTYRTSFTANDDDTNARISFYFGDDANLFYLANVTLRPGVQYAMEDESLDKGSVKLYGETESQQRKVDRMVFLAETEKAYFDGMKAFIQDDLGCKAMVTGTIVFGPLGLYAQSDMDFIDSHAYWQHPRFPNRPWDAGDWLIEQKAMSGNPPGTLYGMAAERLAGKPFTVTEYNHPAPLDSQAECVPMIASFAAAQDWDGVWLYTYSHSSDSWEREHLNSYFDIDTNPAKWGFMLSGRKVFERSIFCNTHLYESLTTTNEPLLETLSQIHLKYGSDLTASLSKSSREYPVLFRKLRADNKVDTTIYRCPSTGYVAWDVDEHSKGLYRSFGGFSVIAGATYRFEEINKEIYPLPLSDTVIENIEIDYPGYAAVTVVRLDDLSQKDKKRILITACGRVENTGMQFSADRRTVGRNWGAAPVRIEPVEGTIGLPRAVGGQTTVCKILHPDGTVKETIELTDNTVPLKAEYGTMWYLVERTAAD